MEATNHQQLLQGLPKRALGIMLCESRYLADCSTIPPGPEHETSVKGPFSLWTRASKPPR
jgi:hypothetical protein